ncbi:hypothetical protein [Kaistia defluvii]|uniref:Uncharacterized protein n=1 Tax=Kaistia defluvii TaxID=410841 RepID=A0ABV2R0Y1_9HYPH
MLLHPEATVRDRRFRHDLFPASDALRNLVADIVERLLRYEDKHHVRKRKRKPRDLDGLRNVVAGIVANLVHSTVFSAASAAIILPLANARKVRISPVLPGFGRGLKAVLQGLQAIGVAIVTLPTELHQATTIAPSEGFRGEVLLHAFTTHDFRWSPVIDCIHLNRKDRQGKREAFAIPTTAEAALYREEMEAINGYLASADIAYVGNDPVDTSDRLMARYFNHPPHVSRPSLDLGGRMFGGFWQGLKRGARRHIRISGEPIVELDYRQMFPRLAYSHVQAGPPSDDDDLYDLPQLAGIGSDHRDTVKKAFNALMFKAGTMRKWPPEIAEGLPSGCSVGAFRKALVGRHPAITDLLNTGIGYRLMNRESCIMCRVLMGCIALGITVLPIHDAVLCPASAAFMVQQIMADAARYVVGHTVPVSVKP